MYMAIRFFYYYLNIDKKYHKNIFVPLRLRGLSMKKGDDTREKIIQVSLELFHAKGYFNTSVNDITEHAGIKKGGLYFHIQSKEQLAIIALEEARINYERIISDGIENLPPLAQIEQKIAAIVQYHIDRGVYKGCLFGNMALEIGYNDSDISQFLKKVFREWERSFEVLINQAVATGELELRETPKELAKTILATIEGGVLISKISGDTDGIKNCAKSILMSLNDRKIKMKVAG